MKLLPEHTAKHVTKSIVTEVTEFHASKLFVTATVHFLHKTVQYWKVVYTHLLQECQKQYKNVTIERN